MMSYNYDTLSQAIKSLRDQGYTEDFNLKTNCVECKTLDFEMRPEDFTIDRMFRFEGMTDPSDASVLYAISADERDVKGVLVDAYGVYADPLTHDMIEKLRYRPEQ